MALNGCFQYWANQAQDKEAGEIVAPGVVLVEKTYSSEQSPQLTQITLNFEDYGQIIYDNGNAGSSTNPYAIISVDDLIYVFDHEALGYCHLTNNLNFNDSQEYKFGYDRTNKSGTAVTSSEINGLNYRIQNLILCPAANTSYAYFKKYNLKNLIFENLIVQNGKETQLVSQSGEILTNVKIGCYFFGSKTKFFFGNHSTNNSLINYTDCTFNIKGTCTTGFDIGSCIFTRCHINIDLISTSSDLADSCIINTLGTNYYRPQFINSYITGFLKFKHPVSYFIGDGVYNSSYICIELDSTESPSDISGITGCSNTGNSYSFFTILDSNGNDIDFTDFYQGISNPVELLSYEKAIDPVFLLEEKGFPVAKSEDDE